MDTALNILLLEYYLQFINRTDFIGGSSIPGGCFSTPAGPPKKKNAQKNQQQRIQTVCHLGELQSFS